MSGTKRFSLDGSAYRDISEGHASCSFRHRFEAQRNNALRIVLADALPDVETVDFDRFDPPQAPGEDMDVRFPGLVEPGRVYARADKPDGSLDLVVYQDVNVLFGGSGRSVMAFPARRG